MYDPTADRSYPSPIDVLAKRKFGIAGPGSGAALCGLREVQKTTPAPSNTIAEFVRDQEVIVRLHLTTLEAKPR